MFINPNVRPFTELPDLFDRPGACQRRIDLSWLDENIDDDEDWNRLTKRLMGIDCLCLVDDRVYINKIMREYGHELNMRYVENLRQSGILAQIVHMRKR